MKSNFGHQDISTPGLASPGVELKRGPRFISTTRAGVEIKRGPRFISTPGLASPGVEISWCPKLENQDEERVRQNPSH